MDHLQLRRDLDQPASDQLCFGARYSDLDLLSDQDQRSFVLLVEIERNRHCLLLYRLHERNKVVNEITTIYWLFRDPPASSNPCTSFV